MSAVTSATSLSTFCSLPPPRLHSGESHPHGHGWLGPGGPWSAAVSGSRQRENGPGCYQDLNTERTGHGSERGSRGAHLITQEVLKDSLTTGGETVDLSRGAEVAEEPPDESTLLWPSTSPGRTQTPHSRVGTCRDPRKHRNCQKDTHYGPSQPVT